MCHWSTSSNARSGIKGFFVEPDFDISIMKDKQTLFDVTTNILNRIKEVLEEVKPDVVLVIKAKQKVFEK